MTAADYLKSVSPHFEGYLEGQPKGEKRRLRRIFWQLGKATRRNVEQEIAQPEVLVQPDWEQGDGSYEQGQRYKIIVEPQWAVTDINLTKYGLGRRARHLDYESVFLVVGVKECSPRKDFNRIEKVNRSGGIDKIVARFSKDYNVPHEEIYGYSCKQQPQELSK